jgi:hypothetical protein
MQAWQTQPAAFPKEFILYTSTVFHPQWGHEHPEYQAKRAKIQASSMPIKSHPAGLLFSR